MSKLVNLSDKLMEAFTKINKKQHYISSNSNATLVDYTMRYTSKGDNSFQVMAYKFACTANCVKQKRISATESKQENHQVTVDYAISFVHASDVIWKVEQALLTKTYYLSLTVIASWYYRYGHNVQSALPNIVCVVYLKTYAAMNPK